MKKYLLVLTAIALFASNGRAQQYLIDSITLPSTGGDYGFYVDIDVDEGVKVLYDLQAFSSDQRARAELSSGDVKSLVTSLEKAMVIFEKWSKLAREEKMKLVSKRFPTIFVDQNIYFTQEGKWYFEKGVDMHAIFFVDADGECQFILESDYMTSSELAAQSTSVGLSFAGSLLRGGILGISGGETKYTVGRYCGGSSLTFKNVDEIKEFIKKLNSAIEWKKQNIACGKALK